MNDLGILLAWSALQATLPALAAVAICLFAARRRPAMGAAVAAAGLGATVALPLLTLCPLPPWWGWQATETAAPAPSETVQVDAPIPPESSRGVAPGAAPAPADGPAWPVDLARRMWKGAGQAAAPFANHSGFGWGIAATIALAGAAFGLLRLAGGLWAVANLRRRSRPVLDDSAHRILRQLREEMGCRGPVDLMESSGLGAPAVAGWLWPAVLLPADWREWTEPELRAALAHEIAHVRRSDYLLGLMARLGLALHFYHPLLYWLAGRLRLQQELAADALAAPSAGGRDAYLMGLARLALRLSDRRPAGWPANPLFSRGTLMRRIRMLKTKDGGFTRPTPRWGRALVGAVLAAAAVGASALRCPAQKAADPQQAPAAAPEGSPALRYYASFRSLEYQAFPIAKELAVEAPEPFDLSYVPPDAKGVVCIRPSALLGLPGLKKDADAANKVIAEACKAAELSRALGLRVEEIAQVSVVVSIKTDKEAKGLPSDVMIGTPAMFRATKDFDWVKELKELLPGVKEARHGDHVIYQLPADGRLAEMNGGIMCCYVPDGRTIVFGTEEYLTRLIERKPGDAPAWAADFKRFERGLAAAIVLDNRDGAWGRELAAGDESDPDIAPFQDHTSWLMVGFSADDDFVADASARFDGEQTAEKAVKAIEGGLAAARDALATPEAYRAALGDGDDAKEGKDAEDKEYRLYKALIQQSELKRDGALVHLRFRAKGDVTEFLSVILNSL